MNAFEKMSIKNLGNIEQLDEIIKADSVLFFDMDGTLVDTNLANFLSYKQAIQQAIELDIDIPYNPMQRFNSGALKKVIPYLCDTEYEVIIQLKNGIYTEHLSKTKLNEPLVFILQKYSKSHKTVLVTNSQESRASMILEYHKLIDYFSHKFYLREMNGEQNNKYDKALYILKIPPESAIVFEDEEVEIAAAIDAGIPHENIITTLINN